MRRDQYNNFVMELRRHDAIGLSYIRFAYPLSIAVAHTFVYLYDCPEAPGPPPMRSALSSRYSAMSSLNARATTLRFAPDCSPVTRGRCCTSTSVTLA